MLIKPSLVPFTAGFIGGMIGWFNADFGRSICFNFMESSQCTKNFGMLGYLSNMALGFATFYVVCLLLIKAVNHLKAKNAAK